MFEWHFINHSKNYIVKASIAKFSQPTLKFMATEDDELNAKIVFAYGEVDPAWNHKWRMTTQLYVDFWCFNGDYDENRNFSMWEKPSSNQRKA